MKGPVQWKSRKEPRLRTERFPPTEGLSDPGPLDQQVSD